MSFIQWKWYYFASDYLFRTLMMLIVFLHLIF
jgi:hypothetical protein